MSYGFDSYSGLSYAGLESQTITPSADTHDGGFYKEKRKRKFENAENRQTIRNQIEQLYHAIEVGVIAPEPTVVAVVQEAKQELSANTSMPSLPYFDDKMLKIIELEYQRLALQQQIENDDEEALLLLM